MITNETMQIYKKGEITKWLFENITKGDTIYLMCTTTFSADNNIPSEIHEKHELFEEVKQFCKYLGFQFLYEHYYKPNMCEEIEILCGLNEINIDKTTNYIVKVKDIFYDTDEELLEITEQFSKELKEKYNWSGKIEIISVEVKSIKEHYNEVFKRLDKIMEDYI